MTHMTRRKLITAAAALSFAFALPLGVQARTINFSVPTYQKLVDSGMPFLIGVHTEWCSTCAVQKRVISALKRTGNPYAGMTILEMDWDKYRGSRIGKQLRIPRRSTLIMFAGGKEAGRIIAGTSARSIQKLIDKGLK